MPRPVDVERRGGVAHCVPRDGDARHAHVVERGIRVVGDHGRVRHAGRGGVADVEWARLGAPQRHQAVGEPLAHHGARLRDQRQRPPAEPYQPARPGETAQVAVAAPERDVRNCARADGQRLRRQRAARGGAIAVDVVVLTARRARLVGKFLGSHKQQPWVTPCRGCHGDELTWQWWWVGLQCRSCCRS